MQSIRQGRLETHAKLYMKLSTKVLKQIQVLKSQASNAGRKAKDGSLSVNNRLVWKGMEIAYRNALGELELAYERTHYSEKFKERGQANAG